MYLGFWVMLAGSHPHSALHCRLPVPAGAAQHTQGCAGEPWTQQPRQGETSHPSAAAQGCVEPALLLIYIPDAWERREMVLC